MMMPSPPSQLLLKEKVDDDFEVEFDFVQFNEEENCQEKIAEIDQFINSLSDKVAILDAEIDKLTNHADGFDYIVAVASGVLAGLIDSFYVGEIDWNKAKANAHETINRFIQKKAEAAGYQDQGKGLQGAIEFLEKHYRIPTDNVWSGNGISSTQSHHLDDMAHHPTLLGLIANLVAILFRTGIFVDRNGSWHFVPTNVDKTELAIFWSKLLLAALLNWLVIIAERKYSEEQEKEIPAPIRALIHLLASAPAIIPILKATDNWIGHLISDMGGSKNTAGGGMGIPGVFLSLLKEISSLPGINQTRLPELVNDWYTKDKFDLRKEFAVFNIAKKQLIPVLLNEVLVRGFYFVRHLIAEARRHGTNWSMYDWQKILPFGNRTIIRMLTIAHGSLVAVDLIDAAARTALSGQYVDVTSFLAKMALRVNFVGIGRFTIAIYSDAKMGIQRSRRVAERMDLKSKMLNFYGAKIYCQSEKTWIEAQKAEIAILQMNKTVEQTIVLWMQSQKEMQNDITAIGKSVDQLEKKNPGLRETLLGELK